jgi:hypothetical protein
VRQGKRADRMAAAVMPVMFGQYVKFGWKLCAIDRGKKGPTYPAWQLNPISEEAADAVEGAGLLHAVSGTCALDIDNLEAARPWLAERGVDIDALLEASNAVRIHSGRKGRAKLLYRLKKPLRTFKPKGSGVEFRCATAGGTSVQDVLPGTVHPDTHRPYEWRYGGEPMLDADWRSLPPIPSTLLHCWRQLLEENPAEKLNGTHHPTETAHPLAALATWTNSQDPNAEYDEWVKVGMKLHHATGGAQEGFDLWNSWSAQATRKAKNGAPVYQGQQSLRAHWVSFTSPKGKVVATVNNELPASADEFETITPEQAKATPDQKAQEAAASTKRKEALDILNERLVYVRSAEKYFDLKYHQIIGSDNALEHQFTHLMPRRKGVRISPVKLLKETGSKQVDKLGFHPGESALFRSNGYSFANNYIDKLPKPLKPTAEELKKINWLFNRIDDEDYRHWFKQFYAHAVQRPGVKIKSIPLLWSDIQRNGKSTMVKNIPMLLVGSQYSTDVSTALLNSDFNDYLLDAWHVNLSEFRAGTRTDRSANMAKLRAWITDDIIPMHPKGSRGYSFPNHFFMTASSNEDDAVPVDTFDERWGIHHFTVPKYTDAEQQWIYHEFMNTPRAAGVLRHYFLNYTLTGFNAAGSAPGTKAKTEMAGAAQGRDAELLQTLWEQQEEFFTKDAVLISDVVAFIHKNTSARPSGVRVGKLLARPPINGRSQVFRVGGSIYRAVIVRKFDRWLGANGKELMAHIRGDDDSIDFME